ncbi:MAG: proline--tRNA ligase [Anaerolineaceae bacterium]|nr:proline--tRNA ligase [Anaerolineaceae bacterium]
MAQQAVTPQSVDFSKWYNEIVYKADLCDLSPVRGCLIIKPYGYELWEAVKNGLDRRFKATGHQNAYFPLFIPESFLKREAQHVEGFSPELAVVTIAGGKELEEPLVVRPTSETIIMDSFKNWIQSYRDLPLLINQWANVVRWELRTRPFLRTTEFLWQEGHTAHATTEEAEAETMQMLEIYADFAINDAAIPVIKGRKTEREKFAGAVHTYTIEAMMKDTKALQSGTSHNLGQNFSKAFEITFLDQNNETQNPWTTSWGLSTRMVGAIVMTHGDDKGLRLPPKVAPIQVVVVPIFKNDDEKATVMSAVTQLSKELLEANIRIHVDKREGMSPGFKYNDWEMRGVPLRMEVGPKDVQNGTVALARRDIPGKEGKQFLPQAGIAKTVQDLLNTIQSNMLQQATEFRDANIFDVSNYDELKGLMDKGGWARVWWAGSSEDEARIKEETGATVRCIPFEQPGGNDKCFFTGKPADTIALFAKAY